MTVDQLAVFLKAGEKNHYGLLYLFLADTGARPGEALALRWTDLDLPARQVTIERAAERGGRIKSTKTGTSRVVDLTPRLMAALDRWQTDVEAKALATGRDVPELVFPGASGAPLDDVNVGRRFQEVCVRAGLPRFNLYSLRHTYASHLLAMGAPITYVANQLGHSKPTMTLQYYAHFMPRGDRVLADQLEAVRTLVLQKVLENNGEVGPTPLTPRSYWRAIWAIGTMPPDGTSCVCLFTCERLPQEGVPWTS